MIDMTISNNVAPHVLHPISVFFKEVLGESPVGVAQDHWSRAYAFSHQ